MIREGKFIEIDDGPKSKRGKNYSSPICDSILWVLKAIGKDKYHYNLTFLNVESSFFACTDGCRIHCASINVPIPDGNYKPIISRKNYILLKEEKYISFPDYWVLYKNMMPLNGRARILYDHLPGLNNYYNRSINQSSVVYKIFKMTEATFQISYIQDACWLEWIRPKYEISKENDGRIRMFTIGDKDRFATIMAYAMDR
jgi:hypothetical protein